MHRIHLKDAQGNMVFMTISELEIHLKMHMHSEPLKLENNNHTH